MIIWEDRTRRERRREPLPFPLSDHERWAARFNWLLLVCWVLLIAWLGGKAFG